MFRFTMRDVLWLTVVVALGSGINGATGFGAEIPKEMEGKWKSVACERSGEVDELCEKFSWEITEKGIQVTEGRETWKLVITMLDRSVTPWQIDWRCDEGDREFVAKGIIRCEGGSLQLCGVAGAKADALMRPTEFATRKGDGGRIMCLLSRIEE
jgi:uncharacterized protein (TIGR03067 family)